ncbi:hypothetical protein STEG23_030703, partial [Scotinomys teguina]
KYEEKDDQALPGRACLREKQVFSPLRTTENKREKSVEEKLEIEKQQTSLPPQRHAKNSSRVLQHSPQAQKIPHIDKTEQCRMQTVVGDTFSARQRQYQLPLTSVQNQTVGPQV